jgi:hypothetical protein
MTPKVRGSQKVLKMFEFPTISKTDEFLLTNKNFINEK